MKIAEIETAVGKRSGAGWERTGSRRTLAVCDDIWAIRPDEDRVFQYGDDPLFKLIHRQTGYAVRTRCTWDEVCLTLQVIQSRDLDWNWSDPQRAKGLADEYRAIKAEVTRLLEEREKVAPRIPLSLTQRGTGQ